MGLFCVNLHFQTNDDQALRAALNRRNIARFCVIPAHGGWTTLYEEQASGQDDGRIGELAGGLSRDLHTAAIAFLVHDSDIASYWLFDNGQLLDEFNSCPDYFDMAGPGEQQSSPSGGRTDLLIRFCRPGVREEELAAILRERTVFADDVIQRLADALGIEPERALADYRDIAEGDGPDGMEGVDDGDDGGPNLLARRPDSTNLLAGMLGLDSRGASADPQVKALVQAAARDDVDEISRLLAAGVAIDAEAPAPFLGKEPLAGLGQFFPGEAPNIAMTPLLAAVVNKRFRATQRLLDGGANPNREHPLFGCPIHIASGAGEVALLQLLIERGGDVSARSAQGRNALQVIAAGRASLEQLAQVQATMKAMGIKMPGLVEQMSNVVLPIEGWNACEELLKANGAR
jgi:hypothetical protein